MKYQSGQRRKALEYEKAIAKWWKKDKTFEKSVKNRPIDNSYVFYDGPPFLTGLPHHGHLLGSTIKDVVGRYQTMNGKRVERVWGWDCHGLPAENYVEKQLGILDRREIGTKWSLEEYILTAKKSMEEISDEWEHTIDRIGRWVDFKGAYRTMDKDFMESVWWAFKQLYDAGKIYEGRKVLMYDTKFATPVSKAEVTMDNDAYQTVTDPSAHVKFKLVGVSDNAFLGDISRFSSSETYIPAATDGFAREAGGSAGSPAYDVSGEKVHPRKGMSDKTPAICLLAWTTTPWTLMANRALAVKSDLTYGFYDVDGEIFIVAQKLAEKLFEGKKPLKTLKGKDLAGLKYESIDGTTCQVFTADFVGEEEGTGIVHIAPAYGPDDYDLYKEHEDEIGFVDTLDENGYYTAEYADKLHTLGVRDTDESGIQVWAGNKFIAKCLEEKGIVYKIEYIKHEYPFNPRSKERIIYRAFPSWFMDIEGQKPLMLAENENINWFPDYLKHGRFENTIETAPDWNLSRDRFWATAMPVWKGDKGSVKVVGSYAELKELSGQELDDYHRPWVDEITFDIDGEHFTRIEKVLDCWFESGSMPFAQMHYPFENKEKFEQNYPADFIVEYVGQVRAWFYYVHAVNTALAEIGAFGKKAKKGAKNAYKNVITTGTIAGNDGRKMSKSIGNFTDPNILMDQYSADALRFLLLSSPVCAGEDFALLDKDVSDTNRKLAMLWNVYDFFTTYAEVEGLGTEDFNEVIRIKSPLDKWIIERFFELRDEITEGMEEYNIPKALAGVLPFIDDLSNWYVRRSRRRFSKNADKEDKRNAFYVLRDMLIQTATVLAPFTPFLSEELYQKLTGSDESIHLQYWPGSIEKGHENILEHMARTRQIITDALALRMQKSETEAQIKIRQPLSSLTYPGEKLDDFYEQIIAEEVNVKEVKNGKELTLDKTLTKELLEEGTARELVRAIQSVRKHAGLNPGDKIKLSLSSTPPKAHEDMIKSEVQADQIELNQNFAHDEIAKINGENITISLEKI